MMLVFAGVVIGAVHSYCAPIQLRPANNPEPGTGSAETTTARAGTEPGTQPETAGTGITPPETVAASPEVRIAPPNSEPPKADPPSAEPNYFITLDRAKELFDKGRADGSVYFVDARPPTDYQAGHITGATFIPPAFGGIHAKKAKEYFPGQTVVVYCHGATCTDSLEVMIGLQNLRTGIGAIYIMKDGFDAWRARGWPVERGPDPLQ